MRKSQKSKVKSQNYRPATRGIPLLRDNSKFKIKKTFNFSLFTFNSQRKLGFTLLELLVVISIIVLLVTLGLSSFSTAQKKGRDAKRKGDIREVQTALEQYYSVCRSLYPTPASDFFTSIVCTSPSIAIMPTIPADPRGITPYYCGPTPQSSNCTSTGFTICAMLEAETPNTFCVTNQQ